MRWTGHVSHVGESKVCTGFWWGNLKESYHWEDPGVNGRIILKCIFRTLNVRAWIASM